MKKKLAIILGMVICLSAFTGCNVAKQNSKSEEVESSSKDTDTFRLALLIPGLLGDKSFFDNANAAIPLIEAELAAEFDVETKVVEMGLDQTKWYPTLLDFCEQDYDLILTISPTINDILNEVAAEYPNQKFINIDTQVAEVPKNVYALSTRANEMSFLAGAAGALKAQELGNDRIGFIGGMDNPGINEFLIGYISGAQYVNKDIKVLTSYVGSFTDTAKGKENAIIMYNSGIPVIYVAAGQSGLGVIDAGKELGKFVIGVDTDQAMALKDSDIQKSEIIITSAIKKTAEYTLQVVKDHIAGTVPYGQLDLIGLKTGAVGIAKNEFYENSFSEKSKATLDEIEAKIMTNEIKIIETANMPIEVVYELREFVRP